MLFIFAQWCRRFDLWSGLRCHKTSTIFTRAGSNVYHDVSIEPCHEIMVLSVLCKLILQTRRRSHPVGLDVWFLDGPSSTSILCANSEGSGETAWMRRLTWAFTDRLCDKYHNLMSQLIWSFELLSGPVAQSDAHLPGIQTVAGSIVKSGKTFFPGDWNHFYSYSPPTTD